METFEDEIPDLVSAYGSWSGSRMAQRVDWEPEEVDERPSLRRYRPAWSGRWESEWRRAELERQASERERREREALAARVREAQERERAEQESRRRDYEAWKARNRERERLREEIRRVRYEIAARKRAEELSRRRAAMVMESRDQFSDPDSVRAALDSLMR